VSDVYHLELRQFPHVTRVFNLDRAELDERFVVPWIRGTMIDHDEHRWAPDKTRLKVMAGPPLRPDALGLGRGWGTVTKESQDVTDAVIAAARRGADARPEVQALKQQVVQRAAQPIDLRAVVALAGAAHPGWRASEQVSAAEQAVWELLHEGGLAMLASGDGEVPAERWQELLLSFASWATPAGAEPVLVQVRAND
jgi:hypothetical protein